MQCKNIVSAIRTKNKINGCMGWDIPVPRQNTKESVLMLELKKIDRDITEGLNKAFDNPFHLEEALLFGVETFLGEPPLIVPLSKNKDVYEMLYSEETAAMLTPYTKFSIVTCGWAAPIQGNEKDDIKPSEHEKRKRIRIMCYYEDGKISAALHFQGDDEVIYEEGNTSGDLKEAIFDLYVHSRILKQDVLND